MKLSTLVPRGFLVLLCVYQLAQAQALSDLSLAAKEKMLTPPQAVALENAITSLPSDFIRDRSLTWIKTAKSGDYEQAMNASLAILAAAMRRDGWEIISDRYPEILDLMHSPYPNVQQRSLLVAVHEGVRDVGKTVLALQNYIARGSSPVVGGDASLAAERSVRASAVQELLRLAPNEDTAHVAINMLLSEDLSANDRLIIVQSLGDENPASNQTVAILMNALDDSSPALREGAARSLERLSGYGNEVLGRVGLKLLQMSSEDPEPRVRAAAKEALSHPQGTHSTFNNGAEN